jgi:hypothetical protein
VYLLLFPNLLLLLFPNLLLNLNLFPNLLLLLFPNLFLNLNLLLNLNLFPNLLLLLVPEPSSAPVPEPVSESVPEPVENNPVLNNVLLSKYEMTNSKIENILEELKKNQSTINTINEKISLLETNTSYILNLLSQPLLKKRDTLPYDDNNNKSVTFGTITKIN